MFLKKYHIVHKFLRLSDELNYKKTCLLCSFKRKGVKNIREKQKMNWYKVHKELRRKFKPQRIKEYWQNKKKLYSKEIKI